MEKMKNIIYNCFCYSVNTFGCTKDFAETIPTQNQFNQLTLRQVIYNFGENMSYEGFVAGDLLSTPNCLRFQFIDRHALKSPQLEESLAYFL
jgi:hypothetical protein